MNVITLGMINSKKLVNKVLKSKMADLVAVSRRFINEPKWLLKKNSKRRRIKNSNIPKQYLRCF